MKTLRQTLRQAESDAVAIGHFNISDLVGLKAAFDSAQELNVPVIVGTSEGEREFMGVHQVTLTLSSTTWGKDSPTASRKVAPALTSSEPLFSGASDNASSSSMTDERPTSLRPSEITGALAARQIK
jgi:hypothetical protein